jgi:hypothetical protein
MSHPKEPHTMWKCGHLVNVISGSQIFVGFSHVWVIFHLQKFRLYSFTKNVRSSSLARLILPKIGLAMLSYPYLGLVRSNWYFSGPGWVGENGNKANSAQLKLELGLSMAIYLTLLWLEVFRSIYWTSTKTWIQKSSKIWPKTVGEIWPKVNNTSKKNLERNSSKPCCTDF